MRLILIAPVADRAWAIEPWMRCLASQTRRPDLLLFMHSGRPNDETWRAIRREAARHHLTVAIKHDPAPAHQRADNERFRTLGRIRNRLLDMAAVERADLVLSLDTDVMLTNPDTIQRLSELVLSGECDIAAPLAFLHPGAPRTWTPGDDVCWAYNLGFLHENDTPGPERPWQRPDPQDLPFGERIRMQIPMAVWLGNQRVLSCRYEWHESGEDIGFAQDLERHDLTCISDTSLYAFHVWSEAHLPALQTA